MFRRVFLFALVISFSALFISAQTGWEYHTRAGEWAFANGDQGKAEQSFRAALKEAQSFSAGDPRVERSYSNLARLLEHQTRLDESQPLYELLLAAQELRVGKSHPALLDTLAGLGRVALGAGDIPTADANLRRYVTVADATGKADVTQARGVLTLLTRMATLAERHDEALSFQRRITTLSLKDDMLLPSEKADLVDKQLQMELLYGQTENTIPLIEKAAELRSQEGDTAPAMTWARSASAALGAAEPEIAEQAALRALELNPGAEAKLLAVQALADASWLRVRRSHESMSELISVAGDSESLQAADERTNALVEAQTAAGTDTVETVSRLVEIKVLRGQFSDAADLQQRAVAKESGSKQLKAALEDLCTLHQAAGALDNAVSTNTQIIALVEAQEGAESASLVAVLEHQIELLTEAKRKKEARAAKKKLRKLRRNLR